MADLIHEEESLNKGRKKINDSIKQSERAEGKSDSAVSTSNNAMNIARQSDRKSDDTQQQLDDIVLNDGTGNAEVIQARGGEPLLKDRLNKADEKLDDIEKADEFKNNAPLPIPIPTYEGSGQTVHPDVLYFKNKWNGFRYWMCHTPYPNTNDIYENPSIVVSQDGVTWVVPPGLTNPLDQPTESELQENVHLSDGVIFMVGNTMECWYRYRNKTTNEEKFLRRTTIDGVNWTPKEVVYMFTVDTSRTWGVSPTLIHENGKYRMWFVSGDGIWLTESTTGEASTWSELAWVRVNWLDESIDPWHIDVTKNPHDGRFNLIIATVPVGVNDRYIAHASSPDGKSFGEAKIIMSPSLEKSGWDNKSLYRASLVYVDDMYRLYYSAMNVNNQWKVGLVEGLEITKMTGVLPVNQNGTLLIDNAEINKLRLRSNQILLDNVNAYFKNTELQFHEMGVSSVKIKMTDKNTLEIQSESGSLLGIIKLSTVLAARLQTSRLDSPDGKMNLLGNIKIVSDSNSSTSGFLSVTDSGVGSVGLKPEANNITQLTDENGNRGNILGVAGIWFNTSRTAPGAEGMIRYNASTKKHEGHDGTKWNSLY